MGSKRRFQGTVVSDKMTKTRVVKVLQSFKHPKYGKIVKTYTKFKAHDEKPISHTGDLVIIEETRPLSKDKRFRVVSVVKKSASLIQIKDETVEIKVKDQLK